MRKLEMSRWLEMLVDAVCKCEDESFCSGYRDFIGKSLVQISHLDSLDDIIKEEDTIRLLGIFNEYLDTDPIFKKADARYKEGYEQAYRRVCCYLGIKNYRNSDTDLVDVSRRVQKNLYNCKTVAKELIPSILKDSNSSYKLVMRLLESDRDIQSIPDELLVSVSKCPENSSRLLIYLINRGCKETFNPILMKSVLSDSNASCSIASRLAELLGGDVYVPSSLKEVILKEAESSFRFVESLVKRCGYQVEDISKEYIDVIKKDSVYSYELYNLVIMDNMHLSKDLNELNVSVDSLGCCKVIEKKDSMLGRIYKWFR